MEKTPGLYIHIPFCRRKCPYCSFYSVSDPALIPRFTAAVCREMAMNRGEFPQFDTVYFGGGTPSVLGIEPLREIIKAIHDNFTISADNEWTIEVNPTGIDKAFLCALPAAGFNRLNVGVQSFDDRILSFLGRLHNAGEARTAVSDARGTGFANIGLDLIYGVPGQDMESWMETLRQAVTLSPEHLSCYQLTIDDGTPLGSLLARGKIHLPGEDLQYEFFMKTSEFLQGNGYIHYEISNFSLPGYASRHNRKYWDHTPYLGLGPSAHSFSGKHRWWNHPDVQKYTELLESGKSPRAGCEDIGAGEACLEMLALGLRTRRGIDLGIFEQTRGRRLDEREMGFIRGLAAEGYGQLRGNCFLPTLKGMAVADRLAIELAALLDQT